MMGARDREQWRKAIAAHEDAAAVTEDAPEPERLWEALSGELDALDARDVLVRGLRSGQGHEELRLFLELERALEVEPPMEAPRRIPGRWVGGVVVLAAAALVWLLVSRPSKPPVPDSGVIRAPVSDQLDTKLDGSTLPRDAFELRWNEAGEQCTYAVRASTSDAHVLVDVEGVASPLLRLTPAQLERVPSGGTVLWQVDFQCEDGRGQSRTFSTAVEP